MSLPEFVTDLASAVTFILSGFLAANFALHLSQRKIRETNLFDITLWSLAGSVFIYAIDLLLDWSLVALGFVPDGWLSTYFPAISLVLAFPVGILGALFLTWDWAAGVRQWLHLKGGVTARVGPLASVWDRSFRRARAAWVLVHTGDGREYYGSLIASSVEGEPREVLLGNPGAVVRAQDGAIKEVHNLGEKMLFLEDDIRRIVFIQIAE